MKGVGAFLIKFSSVIGMASAVGLSLNHKIALIYGILFFVQSLATVVLLSITQRQNATISYYVDTVNEQTLMITKLQYGAKK